MRSQSAAFLAAMMVGGASLGALPLAQVQVAWAAPAARYRAGMKVRAKRSCSVKGFQVKKGVVMSITAVRSDDKGRVASVDLAFSGMAIADVSVRTLDSLFGPA